MDVTVTKSPGVIHYCLGDGRFLQAHRRSGEPWVLYSGTTGNPRWVRQGSFPRVEDLTFVMDGLTDIAVLTSPV